MIRNFHKATADIASSAIQAGGSIASSAIDAANPLAWIGNIVDAVAGVFNGLFDLGKTRNTNSANTAQTLIHPRTNQLRTHLPGSTSL